MLFLAYIQDYTECTFTMLNKSYGLCCMILLLQTYFAMSLEDSHHLPNVCARPFHGRTCLHHRKKGEL
jgi:hypothetical protein